LVRVKPEAAINFVPIDASFNSMRNLNGLRIVGHGFTDQASIIWVLLTSFEICHSSATFSLSLDN
jgi:hypothetical protein